MASSTPKPASKAKPARADAPQTTPPDAATERNVMLLGEETFDSAMELQMSFFEAASRFAQEFSNFAARRTGANVEDFSKLAGARTPPEVLQLQLCRRSRRPTGCWSSPRPRWR